MKVHDIIALDEKQWNANNKYNKFVLLQWEHTSSVIKHYKKKIKMTILHFLKLKFDIQKVYILLPIIPSIFTKIKKDKIQETNQK